MANPTAVVNDDAGSTHSFPCDLVADLDVGTWGRATLAALLAGRQSLAATAMSHPPVSIEVCAASPASEPALGDAA